MRLPILPLLLTGALATSSSLPLNNANHIFNAIHASMRQWGSSIHHNGMSFFLASVPEGTRLYHGNADSNPIQEIGWMAFEPEHAMVFARPPRRGPDDDNHQQVTLGQDGERSASGWLHTYKTTKNLRLLYIDGTSAGKSRIGTLDSQDRVVFNDTIDGGVSKEDERARKVCQLVRTEWQGRLDGAEHTGARARDDNVERDKRGQKNKKNEHHKREKDTIERKRPSKKPKKRQRVANELKENKPRQKSGGVLRAITSRFNGIGGDRVRVYYDHFVTAYTFDLDLWPDESPAPRLQHISPDDLSPIRDNLISLILEYDSNVLGSVNWQSIADLIVARYGRFLQGLVHGKHQQKKYEHEQQPLMDQIEHILAGFGADAEDSISLCPSQFLSVPTENSPLAHQALYTISDRICSTLIALRSETDNEVIQGVVRELVGYLDWTIWKECRDCRGDEFCGIPIWPQGAQEDFERPICRKFEEGWGGENGYWGEIWH
ncbi:hypothetical protein BJY01DRAFT_245720 [Aspergillus pseudoustus]|uniref:Stretch-activated Ca2+-permeable channel component-domain-containing protein n=1 Tax=Aspergillus pseudoustus TaxID=1810923 RepID=A0ABR4KCA4_9EURO